MSTACQGSIGWLVCWLACGHPKSSIPSSCVYLASRCKARVVACHRESISFEMELGCYWSPYQWNHNFDVWIQSAGSQVP